MELKEAIEECKKYTQDSFDIWAIPSSYECEELRIAINTVLEELNNRIPIKDIEDKIEELDVVDNAEAIEDIMDRKNYTITETIQMILKELLNNDKNSEIDLVD